jgi:tetratricopeptide (TPR) repeat protein
MALGRLEAAIAAFQAARTVRSPTDPETNFALAVAYDRNQQSALSREHLDVALSRDPRFIALWAQSKPYVPPYDNHYYLGLAHLTRAERAFALYHFRQYLKQAEGSAWRARAESHLSLARAWNVGDEIEVKGTATLDKEKARAVIRRQARRFETCLEKTPDVIFEVRVTKRVGGTGQKREREDPLQPGVTVVIQRTSDGKAQGLRAARDCLQKASESLAFARPAGVSGTWVSVEFPVTAKQ